MKISRGTWALLGVVLVWSLPSIFQHYLARHYDVWTQNFYRYLIGFISILPLALWELKKGARMDGKSALACLWPALPNAIHQVAQTTAVVVMLPGLYMVLGRFSVILAAIMALIFFPDERYIIRHWKFQVGVGLGLAGMAGLCGWIPFYASGRGEQMDDVLIGLLMTAAFSWALYGVMVKRFVIHINAGLAFAAISFFTTLIQFPLMMWFGHPELPLQTSWQVNAILVFSAIICIGVGHTLYLWAIAEFGVAVSQNTLFLCPIGTMAVSYIFFGETITLKQGILAGLLLIGAALALNVPRKEKSPT